MREWVDGHIRSSLLKSRRETALEQIATVDDHLSRARQGLVVMVTHDWNLLAVREELFGLLHEKDRGPDSWRGSSFGVAPTTSTSHLATPSQVCHLRTSHA